ncbi:MAG: OmpA family protein [Weeksellaceae bacterium]
MFRKYIFLIQAFLSFGSFYAQQIDSKYPDIIYDSHYSKLNPNFDSFYGGTSLHYPIPIDLENLLDNNDKWFVSLPKESYLIYQYTDNGIINAPNQDDIIIIENGCCRLDNQSRNPEKAKVYVSQDGMNFIYLGVVDDCGASTLDLEKISFDEIVRFIKIEGLDFKCYPEGFDLKNAYALSGANVDLYTGIKNASEFFQNKTDTRILILENIYFSNNSYRISTHGKKDLDIIVQNLIKYPEIKIQLTGHTDSNASEAYNLILSVNRAQAVQDYLLKKGINDNRIAVEGKGESEPLKPNSTKSGRAINRRVELRRLN